MPKGIVVWSKTAASNATADSAINWQEGQSPSSVNDSGRGMMESTAKWRDDLNGSIVTSGSSTAYAATTNQIFASLAAGLEITFQVNEDCGATVTLNVDGLGAKPLRSAPAVELVAGALKNGAIYRATYAVSNSGEWLLQNYTPTIIATNQVVTASITDGAVTLAKLVDATAQYKILARKSASSGRWEECTLTELLDFTVAGTRGDILLRGASAWAKKALGAANTILKSDGTDVVYGGDYFGSQLLHVQYNVASGSNGGALPGGVDSAYAKRTISAALTNEITGASLASSQITLPAGTYIFECDFMGFDTSVTARGRLRNVTDGTTTLNGMSTRASGTATSAYLSIKGKFTIAAQKVFEIQHWPGGGATQGGAQGQPASTGEVEVYLDAMIWKTA